jgi:hypothetical protein
MPIQSLRQKFWAWYKFHVSAIKSFSCCILYSTLFFYVQYMNKVFLVSWWHYREHCTQLQILKLRPNLAWHLREGGEIELKLSPLEKKDTAKSKLGAAKSKRNPHKHFAHRQVPSHCGVHFQMRSQKYIHMLKFIYEDYIKIGNKYFAAVLGLHICPIKPSAGLPSLMRLSL